MQNLLKHDSLASSGFGVLLYLDKKGKISCDGRASLSWITCSTTNRLGFKYKIYSTSYALISSNFVASVVSLTEYPLILYIFVSIAQDRFLVYSLEPLCFKLVVVIWKPGKSKQTC